MIDSGSRRTLLKISEALQRAVNQINEAVGGLIEELPQDDMGRTHPQVQEIETKSIASKSVYKDPEVRRPSTVGLVSMQPTMIAMTAQAQPKTRTNAVNATQEIDKGRSHKTFNPETFVNMADRKQNSMHKQQFYQQQKQQIEQFSCQPQFSYPHQNNVNSHVTQLEVSQLKQSSYSHQGAQLQDFYQARQQQSTYSQHIPTKPKQPLTSYFMFLKARRETIKNEYPQLSGTDLSIVLSKVWNALTDSERQPFEEEAERARIEYQSNLAAYQNYIAQNQNSRSQRMRKIVH